jgi:hypothetical protein
MHAENCAESMYVCMGYLRKMHLRSSSGVLFNCGDRRDSGGGDGSNLG